MKKITYVLLIVLLFTFITGCSNNKNEDAIKFKDEYESINGKKSKSGKENRKVNIPDDNPFIYITAEDLSKKIDEKEARISDIEWAIILTLYQSNNNCMNSNELLII